MGPISSTDLTIRPYQAGDRCAVHRIAADTAYFGRPVEVVIEDRTLYSDLFFSDYTDILGDYCWVAAGGSRVVGFLAGCPDTAAWRRRWWRTSLLPTIGRGLLGSYEVGRGSVRYGQALAGAWLRREMTHVEVEDYPAHLHINVAEGWRGRGLGRRLMNAYLDQLQRQAIRGVHLNTTSANEAACALYEKLGFRLLDSRASAMWRPWLGCVLQQRSYGMCL